MGLYSFFKNHIINGSSDEINEASGTDIDTSFAKGTIKDNLSNFFSGMSSGVMVPSALKTGKIPTWTGTDITYPFVGIVGYSDHVASSAVSNRTKGRITDFFAELSSDSTVNGILKSVESRCIPNDLCIFYPDVPISAVGSVGSRNSLNLFFPTALTAAVQTKLGKYSVQQCLDIGSDGKLFINPDASHATVFLPRGKGSKYAALSVSKMTIGDLIAIIQRMGGKKELVDMLSLAFRSFLSKEVAGDSAMSNPSSDSIDKYNPKAGKFFDFFKEINPKITDDVISKYLKEKPNALYSTFVNWLNRNSEQTICEKLLSKYYFPCPFEKTYCMRSLGEMADVATVDYNQVKKDYEVYLACIDNSNPETVQELIDSVNSSDSEQTVTANNESSIPTSISANGEFDSHDMKKTLMDICRLAASGSTLTTMCFKMREDLHNQQRENGTVIQRHEGQKREFIRILHAGAASNNPYDSTFLKGNNDKFDTRPFTLDYGELFIRFRSQLDRTATSKFNCVKVSGYTITFEYDDSIESSHGKDEPNYLSNLLDDYVKSSSPINEPSSFVLIYFKDGDFISSGYESPSRDLVEMGVGKIPYVLQENKLGVQEDRIRSHFVYAKQHVNNLSSSNQKLVKTIPTRHTIDKRVIDRLSKKADAEDAAAASTQQ